MAGGGVGEAMLIGAAVGAGTGGVMSAVQDKDVGQGMLLGALGGAATGGIGSGIGGAASTAVENVAANTAANVATDVAADTAANTVASAATDTLANTAANTVAENTVNTLAQQGSNQAATSMASTPALSSTVPNIGANQAASTAMAEGASQGAAGMGQGIFPGMSNANVAGAATTGGISGLMAANGQPAPYQAPETETYNGPLSQFKMAGPSLSQYNYNPNSYNVSAAPGFADGGIASLQTGMFPQSQMDRTQFATPSQMPISREIIGSDYDATISPYTGDIPRFADGGGIDFVRNLQPGGAFGDATSEMYGAVDEALPFLKDITPGGFVGALQPGRMDWEDKQRKKKEEEEAKDRAAQEAKAAQMYNQLAQNSGNMARGGIADLGSYSDGGRLLRGPGDGMSDDIPASIAGKQPARLADGEFVVPADVVSHLGNGSTDAGAKTLYSMMDKVRKARTGSKKQGRDINPDKYVPGMASGGIAAFAGGGEVKHYAGGNLVVNDGQVGYYNTDEYGNQSDFVPLENGVSNNFTASKTGYNPSTYDPNYYNPQYYQNQAAQQQKGIADLEGRLPGLQETLDKYKAIGSNTSAGSLYDLSNLSDTAKQNADLNAYYQKYLGRNIGQGENFSRSAQGIMNSEEAKAWAAANAPLQNLQSEIAAGQKALAPIQQNVDRLANSSISYNPYTVANRPSGNEPQFYGNIYKPEYENYARPGYDMNAQLGVWNNEYGGNAAPTQRQQNIGNLAYEQRAAQQQSLENAQGAAQISRQMINEAVAADKNKPTQVEGKRRGGILDLRRA